MANINVNFNKLPGSYLFSEIARRVAAYSEANPDRTLIRLRFYGNRTQSDTAKLLHTTQVQVSRRERKILQMMRIKLLEG